MIRRFTSPTVVDCVGVSVCTSEATIDVGSRHGMDYLIEASAVQRASCMTRVKCFLHPHLDYRSFGLVGLWCCTCSFHLYGCLALGFVWTDDCYQLGSAGKVLRGSF